jgi:hypothetical protein
MDGNWTMTMLLMAALGPSYPGAGAEAADTNPTLREIEAGCHRLILAHECRHYQDALRRTPAVERERILSEYLATLQDRQYACRCELATIGSPEPPRR